MFSNNAIIRSSLCALSALSLNTSGLKAAEDNQNTSVDSLVTQSKAADLTLSKEATSKYPALSNLIIAVCKQQKTDNGLSLEDANLSIALIKLEAATDIKKAELSENEKAKFIKMSDADFNTYCLSNNLHIYYNCVRTAEGNRFYFQGITVLALKKSELHTEQADTLKKSQKTAFESYNLKYIDFQKPDVYQVQEKIIDQASDIAASVITLKDGKYAIFVDLARIDKLADTWLKDQNSALLRSALTNELSHIRYAKLYPDQDDMSTLNISLSKKDLPVIAKEIEEAMSDFASLIECKNNKLLLAYDLSMALIGRGGTYRLSDQIQVNHAEQVLDPQIVIQLKQSAQDYNNTQKSEDFKKFFDLTLKAISEKAPYTDTLRQSYLTAFRQIK